MSDDQKKWRVKGFNEDSGEPLFDGVDLSFGFRVIVTRSDYMVLQQMGRLLDEGEITPAQRENGEIAFAMNGWTWADRPEIEKTKTTYAVNLSGWRK